MRETGGARRNCRLNVLQSRILVARLTLAPFPAMQPTKPRDNSISLAAYSTVGSTRSEGLCAPMRSGARNGPSR